MSEDSSDTGGMSTLDKALTASRYGLRVFPVQTEHKTPMPGYGWLELASSQTNHVVEDFTRAEELWGDNVSVAWALGIDGYMAVDIDVDDHPIWLSELVTHAAISQTKRGIHLIFKFNGFECGNGTSRFPTQGWGEVRGKGGYIVIAGPDRIGLDVAQLGHAAPFPYPDWLTEYGGRTDVATKEEVAEFIAAHKTASRPNKIESIRKACADWNPNLAGDPRKGRHPYAVWLLTAAAEDALDGYYSFGEAAMIVKNWWQSVTPPERHGREFNGIVTWAVGRVLAKGSITPDPTDEPNGDEPLGLLDGITSPQTPSLLVDGASWLLDEQTETVARWGSGSDILWAQGESMMLVGPPGVGKTTLMAQVLGGLIGVFDTVLGYPVLPANKVLYLAMDRPRQIQRALARTFHESHREALAAHLIVHRGPLASDLGKNPKLLLDLALEAGLQAGDVVIIDSLKDAAVKLSDDEVGGNVNRAIQWCNAADIDVGSLHHQRKGQGGEKPTTLEDVYGNTWLTAGSGSVVLLWGEAGSETVELSHLKQPADPVGPLRVEHDHHVGMSRVERGFDALAFLRSRPEGVTVGQTAQAEHGIIVSAGSAKWKKTERRLRALVRDGHAVSTTQDRVGGHVTYTPL